MQQGQLAGTHKHMAGEFLKIKQLYFCFLDSGYVMHFSEHVSDHFLLNLRHILQLGISKQRGFQILGRVG